MNAPASRPAASSPLARALPTSAAGPRVIIDRLQIDVVPPPAQDQSKVQKQPRTPERGAAPRAPASQIGPLASSMSKRHYLALRYR